MSWRPTTPGGASSGPTLSADRQVRVRFLPVRAQRATPEQPAKANEPAPLMRGRARRRVSSGGLLAALAGGLARDDRRVHVLQDDLLGDDDGGDVLTARDVVHDRLEHLLH